MRATDLGGAGRAAACVLGLLVASAPGTMAEEYPGGVALDEGADIRLQSLSRDTDGAIFDLTIASKSKTYAEYFNGQSLPRSLSDLNSEGDTNPDFLAHTELEAGLKNWWGDGDGDNPSDEEMAEFDEVVGNLMQHRYYALINPVSAAMLADGHDWSKVRQAMVYQGSQQLPYQGMIFGATAVEAGMTLDRAIDHVARTLGVNGTKAREYLEGPGGNGYGAAEFTFYLQKKGPEKGGITNRGDHTDESLYEAVSAQVADFRVVTGGQLDPDLHPGLQDPVPHAEPFDPGTGAIDNPDMIEFYAKEVVVAFKDSAGTEHLGRNQFYVENYRQITQFDANFTGAMADGQVPLGYEVGDGLKAQNFLPDESQTGEFSLGDAAQQSGQVKVRYEYGDGLNSYVKLCHDQHGTCALVYWIPPSVLPNGEKTPQGTPRLGPGIATDTEEDSIIKEVAQEFDGLTRMTPPADMLPWLYELVFDETDGHVRRVEEIEDLISQRWESGGEGAFNGYAPYALNSDKNGHYRSLAMKLDSEAGSDPQEAEILPRYALQTGNTTVTDKSPGSFLYKLAFEDLSQEELDKFPSDTKGNTVVPSGGNLLIEAQTCCGVSSIVGGSTVKRSDDFPPGAQISAVDAQGVDGAGIMASPVAITATVPNDNRAAANPVGNYHLLYPMTRIHADLPPLPEVGPDGKARGAQGQDAKFYGNFVNVSPIWAHAPSHPDYQGAQFRPGTIANPMDREGTPFMSLNGTKDGAGKQNPNYQDFRQGHRYQVTLSAYDNQPPLIIPPDEEYVARGFPPEGLICYPIEHMEYRLFRLDDKGQEVTLAKGTVVDGATYADEDCVPVEPFVELPWIPHADGAHFWWMKVVDTSGKERQLLSEAWVTGEAVNYDLLDQESSRAR